MADYGVPWCSSCGIKATGLSSRGWHCKEHDPHLDECIMCAIQENLTWGKIGRICVNCKEKRRIAHLSPWHKMSMLEYWGTG